MLGRFTVFRRIIVTVIGAVFLGWSAGYAADYLTLEESIAIALQNNPQIKAQNENVRGRLMEKRQSLANLLPLVSLNYSYTRYNQAPFIPLPPMAIPPSTTSLFPDETQTGFRNNYAFSVQATQPLFTGGALYNAYNVAGNTYQATDLTRSQTIRDLKRLVIEGYYRLIQARQTLDVARSSMVSLKSHLDVANAFYNQGMIPKNDLLQSQVSYAQSQQYVIQADNAARIAESNLNEIMNRDLATPIATEKEIPMPPLNETVDQATETAFANRQEIRVTQLQLDSANKGITIARAGYFPSLAATAAYDKIGEQPDVDFLDSWSLGVGATWYIFQGGFTTADVSRATADRNRVLYQLQAQKNRVALEVKNDYLSVQEAKARIAVAEQAIAQAQENLRIQKDRYNLQVSTTTDVLDAESLFAQAQMNYITARSDYARFMAALRSAMGTL